ncbi:MAG: RsmD family RNA methyltransferase [Flavobacterium sp.]|uniref:THUMP-like domain-containing protein n=1 Tax=Flavobacterium sp. TaxID=239 RepID=UPI0022BCF2C1|nr:RsmD family RNA methyltransferase [Flavobacterium sp.]MCZ8198533.1 RsmD family RNA methyltransferase [Flavobacterium sp.]
MNNSLLNTEIQQFIEDNLQTPVLKLALQKNPFPEVDWIEILNQISCKSKAKDKLPTFYQTKNILYPSKISLEQTSSEQTANYKSELVSGKNLIDLTGGFGVDDYFFSKKVTKIVHCELNEELSQIVKHNFEQLKVENSDFYFGDSYEILQNLNQKFDWIYIDPSRRNDAKGKVFMLKDCLPNVPDLLDFYLEYSNNILIKTAPILDISAGLSELKNVKEIHIVAVENEVKELLWIIEKNYSKEIEIKTINFNKEAIERFDFQYDSGSYASIGLPQKYLYEPNSAIMKSGGFNEIRSAFPVEKLHQHSHLYTSNTQIEFPGRIFEIENCFSYSKNDMKVFIEKTKANITTRNFPETVEVIRKKWKIKDGGNRYCFFTTDLNNNKIVLLCKKL